MAAPPGVSPATNHRPHTPSSVPWQTLPKPLRKHGDGEGIEADPLLPRPLRQTAMQRLRRAQHPLAAIGIGGVRRRREAADRNPHSASKATRSSPASPIRSQIQRTPQLPPKPSRPTTRSIPALDSTGSAFVLQTTCRPSPAHPARASRSESHPPHPDASPRSRLLRSSGARILPHPTSSDNPSRSTSPSRPTESRVAVRDKAPPRSPRPQPEPAAAPDPAKS